MLPQLCCRCRKLKPPELGRWVRCRGRCHDRRWVCEACLSKPKISRLTKTHSSPAERRVREVLLSELYKFKEEYPLGPFRFDFAIPVLRLFLEVDSRRWHAHQSRRARDKKKDNLANQDGWQVARLSVTLTLEDQARTAIRRREAEVLG